MTIVLIHVMTVDKYIGTELFSDIRDARKFKEEMRHKYGEKYKFREMVRNLNDNYDDHILNWYWRNTYIIKHFKAFATAA